MNDGQGDTMKLWEDGRGKFVTGFRCTDLRIEASLHASQSTLRVTLSMIYVFYPTFFQLGIFVYKLVTSIETRIVFSGTSFSVRN